MFDCALNPTVPRTPSEPVPVSEDTKPRVVGDGTGDTNRTTDHVALDSGLVAVGLGLVLTGGANLVAGARSRRRIAQGVLAGLAACGAVAAALSVFTRGELAVRAGVLMVGAGAAVAGTAALLRCSRLHRRDAGATAVLWGLLAFGGVALATGAVIGFERTANAVAEQNSASLAVASGRPHQPAARAVTDRGVPIVLNTTAAAPINGTLAELEAKVMRDFDLQQQVIRRGDPSNASNCHGWVFTGGKFLLSPDDVEAILRDNGYEAVHGPYPGDVVIYSGGGKPIHTAVVRYVTEGQPVLVEGKWGRMGVFLHDADKSPYGTDYTFYRSGRRGHLLVGLGGTSPDPTVVASAVAEYREREAVSQNRGNR